MKISKRIISLLMAALLVFGLPLSAFASDGGEIRIATAEDWIQIWIWAAVLRRCLCSAVLLTAMDTASIWVLIHQRLLTQGYSVM